MTSGTNMKGLWKKLLTLFRKKSKNSGINWASWLKSTRLWQLSYREIMTNSKTFQWALKRKEPLSWTLSQRKKMSSLLAWKNYLRSLLSKPKRWLKRYRNSQQIAKRKKKWYSSWSKKRATSKACSLRTRLDAKILKKDLLHSKLTAQVEEWPSKKRLPL